MPACMRCFRCQWEGWPQIFSVQEVVARVQEDLGWEVSTLVFYFSVFRYYFSRYDSALQLHLPQPHRCPSALILLAVGSCSSGFP